MRNVLESVIECKMEHVIKVSKELRGENVIATTIAKRKRDALTPSACSTMFYLERDINPTEYSI